MRRDNDALASMVIGAIGSMALGIALIPLRTLTSASNLAFVFVAFTIVIAELGGRSAALVTAVVSAMSLNFFLTSPYLTLMIDKPDDLVAFLAMAACGVIAASFRKRPARRPDAEKRAETGLEILQRAVERLLTGAPPADVLALIGDGFRLGAIALRDGDGRVVASVPANAMLGFSAATPLLSDTLLPQDESRVRFGANGVRLPADGGRITVATERGPVMLDLWEGDEAGFNVDESRALAIAASMLALEVTRQHMKSIGA